MLETKTYKHQTNLFFVTILILYITFKGAIRNTMEEILLQQDDSKMESDFLVGMESIISLLFMLLLGIVLMFTDPFHEDEDYDDIGKAVNYILGFSAFIVCFCCLLLQYMAKIQCKVNIIINS